MFIFNNKLNFKTHIDYICQKCERAINLLKVVAKMDWEADRSALMRLYRSFVHSRLEYGCTVFSSARKSLKLRSNPDNSTYDVVLNPQLYDLYDKKLSAIRSFGDVWRKICLLSALDLIQTVSLPDDPPWTIQKPQIDLYLTHLKEHLGDDCLLQICSVKKLLSLP